MSIDSILREGFDAFRTYVNPTIVARAEVGREPYRCARTRDGRLVDGNGASLEDFGGSQAFGHRHPAISDAVIELLRSDSATWFPSRVNPYAGALAERLCNRSGYTNAYFASSGSEAVESALKLARVVTGRPRVVSLHGAYHGCTMGSLSLMTDGPLRDPFGPHVPGSARLPFGDIDALEVTFRAGDVAAIVVEPIQLEGGVRLLPEAYVAALCELTAKHGVFLIADEVQTGMGRTGRFLASESWPRRPDAVILGKHLGGGLVGISAMLTRREFHEVAYGRDFEAAEAHNTTFGGNAIGAVASLAALDLLTDEMIARIDENGARFVDELRVAIGALPLVADIRGRGLAIGIELRPIDHPWLTFEHFGMPELDHPTTGVVLCHRLYKHGYFTVVCGHDWSVVRVQPRFTITPEELSRFVRAVRTELIMLSELA